MKKGKWITITMKMIGRKCEKKYSTKCLLHKQFLNNNSNHNSHLKTFSITYLSNQSKCQLLNLMTCSLVISNRRSQLSHLSLLSHLRRARTCLTIISSNSQQLKWVEVIC
jgi:hypothetical protein